MPLLFFVLEVALLHPQGTIQRRPQLPTHDKQRGTQADCKYTFCTITTNFVKCIKSRLFEKTQDSSLEWTFAIFIFSNFYKEISVKNSRNLLTTERRTY